MRRNNGFTLIEVLAVIIILGTLVAIAVPAMLERIEKSKQNSVMSSTEFYIDALQKASVFPQSPDKEIVIGGTYDITTLSDKVDLDKGKSKPTKGVVVIDDEGIVISASLCVNNYKVDYLNGKAKVDSENTCDDIILLTEEEVVYDEIKGVNKPVLATGMTPIKWDVDRNEIVTTEDDSDWYDYANKKWANAKTADGSYWVWIPRYAYKISSGYHTGSVGTIDIKFLKGTTNTTSDETTIESSGYISGIKDTSTNYFVHPSFDFGGAILGYWVAKFEPSVSNQSDLCYTSPSVVNCDLTSLVPKVIPNAKSWKYGTMNTNFMVSFNMKNNNIYGWNASEVDTHLEKNIEWGAVLYLTQSIYGVNSKVWLNNTSTNITGCSGISDMATEVSTCTYTYNSTDGGNSSSTGNITGIYDLHGGLFEMTAAYINNGSVAYATNAQNLLDADIKYKDIYLKGTAGVESAISNFAANLNFYGDAIYETCSAASGTVCFYLESSSYPVAGNPGFIRGGYYHHNSGVVSGLNQISISSGAAVGTTTFRPVVFVSK